MPQKRSKKKTKNKPQLPKQKQAAEIFAPVSAGLGLASLLKSGGPETAPQTSPVKKSPKKSLSKAELTALFQNISDGMSLSRACTATGVSKSVFYRLKDKSKSVRDKYARACEERRNTYEEEIIDTFEDAQGAIALEQITAAKLKIDSLKWILSRMSLAYRDKVSLSADAGGEVTISWAGDNAEKDGADQPHKIAGFVPASEPKTGKFIINTDGDDHE